MPKIAVVTGTRAEYWLLRPLMHKIREKAELQVFVTGMHLSQAFGNTVSEIEKDFKVTDRISLNVTGKNTIVDMADSLSLGISGFIRSFQKNTPDLVVVLGDRPEQLAAATAASFLLIPIAHIHGGEISGNIDNTIRNMITKIAHLHFPTTKLNVARIAKMGEEKWRIHNVGSLGVESLILFKPPTREEFYKKLGLDNRKSTITIVYHPETENWQDAGKIADILLRTTVKFATENNLQVFAVYPNSDAGSHGIISTIESFTKSNKLKSVITLPQEDYFSLLRYSSLLIGNSSSGLIEAPSLNLPFINIGNRQNSRERANNVIEVPEPTEQSLLAAMKLALDKTFLKKMNSTKSPYEGKAPSKEISSIICEELSTKGKKKLLDKKI